MSQQSFFCIKVGIKVSPFIFLKMLEKAFKKWTEFLFRWKENFWQLSKNKTSFIPKLPIER
jgi:hypothetical protein